MSKNSFRLFCASFLLTLLFAGWFTAFLVVDGSETRRESAATVPALGLERTDPLALEVTLLGQRYGLTLAPLNELEALRKQYACLVTPRTLLYLEKLYGYAVYAQKAFYAKYKDEQYMQNVLKSQENVPVN